MKEVLKISGEHKKQYKKKDSGNYLKTKQKHV